MSVRSMKSIRMKALIYHSVHMCFGVIMVFVSKTKIYDTVFISMNINNSTVILMNLVISHWTHAGDKMWLMLLNMALHFDKVWIIVTIEAESSVKFVCVMLWCVDKLPEGSLCDNIIFAFEHCVNKISLLLSTWCINYYYWIAHRFSASME